MEELKEKIRLLEIENLNLKKELEYKNRVIDKALNDVLEFTEPLMDKNSLIGYYERECRENGNK